MRKVVIITFSNTIDEIQAQLVQAGVPKENFEIYAFDDDHHKAIRRMRPEMVIIDGEFLSQWIEELYDEINRIIGAHDMPTLLYAIKEQVVLPGVQNVTTEEIVSLLSNPKKEVTNAVAVVITFTATKNEILEICKNTNADAEKITFFTTEEKDEVLEHIVQYGPKMIVLDGKFSSNYLVEMYHSIDEALGENTVKEKLYSISKELTLSGVKHFTLENFVAALKN